MNIYKENYEMRKKIECMQKAFSEILGQIYCIGGPLNDDARGYSRKQLDPFFIIAEICRDYSDRKEE